MQTKIGVLEKYAWGAPFAAAVLTTYTLIGKAVAGRTEFDFFTPLDDLVPYWPWTVWCYTPFYVIIFNLIALAIPHRDAFFRTLRAIGYAFVICCVSFVALPSTYPIPAIPVSTHPWSAELLAFIRSIDVPNNTFPSSHVALSFACALGVFHDNKRWGVVALVLAACLAVSIVTTKHHYVVDAIAGLAVGYAAYWFAFRTAHNGRDRAVETSGSP
ncbi:MAG: phosphatase PAP2 family protein [Deltaproteobacteria bacterium]|nr:phosphatase PAP2 family protein [Deltaproteobacteria bacterium]